jgi:hypothetical protein
MRRLLQFLCSLTTHRFPLYYEEPWLYAVDNPFAEDAFQRVITCTRCGWYDKTEVGRVTEARHKVQYEADEARIRRTNK